MLTVFDDNERVFQSICFWRQWIPAQAYPRTDRAYPYAKPIPAELHDLRCRQVLKLFHSPFVSHAKELQTLTLREHDVLSCPGEGLQLKMAAAELDVSIETLSLSHQEHLC